MFGQFLDTCLAATPEDQVVAALSRLADARIKGLGPAVANIIEKPSGNRRFQARGGMKERRTERRLVSGWEPLTHTFSCATLYRMKLTIQLKLLPTPAQADLLKHTLETANAACDRISQTAWQTQTFRQFSLHRLTYQAVRQSFGLAAQLTVRCIAKVADAYKRDKTQSSFVCTRCGLAGLADVIAAENIRVLGGALVTAPDCSDAGTALLVAPEQSCRL